MGLNLSITRYVSQLWTNITDWPTRNAVQDLASRVEQLAADLNAIDTFPSGGIVFYVGSACPTGWTENTDLRGRFPRGMPSGGTPGTTGGTAMTGNTSSTGAPSATLNIAAASSSSYVTIVTVDHTHDDTTPFLDGLWCQKT